MELMISGVLTQFSKVVRWFWVDVDYFNKKIFLIKYCFIVDVIRC